MELKIGNISCSEKNPLYIAEEGQANMGDYNLAIKMIDLAYESGADGIEFQLFWAEDMYIESNQYFEYYKQNELSVEEIQSLIQKTKEKNLIFQAACLSPKMVDLCVKEDVDIFVVNATDLNNPEILDAVCGRGIPFWISTLMGTENEIKWAVEYLLKKGAKNFGILHGQHVMASDKYQGVPPEMAQLDCINLLKKQYNVPVGFVDHTPTIHMPSIAVSKGAAMVMKHLAPEENWKGPDWSVALSPADWKKSESLFRYSVLSNGSSKELSQLEIGDRTAVRRGIYTRYSLGKGHVIRKNDLIALRPGEGAMNPCHIDKIIGKKTLQTYERFHNISMDDIE